jgi:mono/diheme cytochrome c family protein
MKSHWQICGRLFIVVAGLLLAVAVFHAAPEPDGAAIFKQRCSMCHGPEGKGFPAVKTPDFTDPKVQDSIKDDEMIEVITNGKKGTPMPAFKEKLKGDEIKAVAAFIRSLNSKKK